MTPTQSAIEAAARAMYHATPRNCPYDALSATKREKLHAEAEAALSADLGDMVLVPREAMDYARQMANICFNLKQSSALDPTTRKAMDETQSGFDRARFAAAEEGK